LLSDNAEYTLGLARADSNPERVARCHQAFAEQVAECVAATREPAVSVVQTFLQTGPLTQLRLPDGFDPSASIVFRVDGVFPVDLPAVRAYWAEVNAPGSDAARPAPVMQCLICGRVRPVLRRLQTKIMGVPGGQPSGTALISANADAFLSYGLEASLIAPTCAVCGERFTQAINHLLADPAGHVVVGGDALAFWTREEHPFSLLDYLNQPQPEQVAELVAAAARGRALPDPDETAFYAITLSGSGGRAVVRDWLDTTVGQVKAHLGVWFQRQRIVNAYGERGRPLGIYPLAAATVRDVARELAPPTPQILWRSALTGAPLPMGMLYQAVRRNRAEQGVTRPRAALIKLVLCSQAGPGDPEAPRMEDSMVQLDPTHTDPAYLCGRLLAVIEEAQRLAVPGIKATVVDRFFGTASSAPALVFGRLLRGAQPHLSKLKRDRPGAHAAIQARLEEVQAGLAGFPRVLTLEEQGLFALGYYHQRAWDRAQAREARARRAAGDAARVDDLEALLDNDEETLTQEDD
jgi:CRISPR-associated protein Csd1